MRHANFKVIKEGENLVELLDLGPWNKYPTITNDAEYVVTKFPSKRVIYTDSLGDKSELLHKNGVFLGFKNGV